MLRQPGRINVQIIRGEKLRNVQYIGKQDPYVEGSLVLGSDEQLHYNATRKEESSVKMNLLNAIGMRNDDDDLLKLLARNVKVWKQTKVIHDGGKNPDWSATPESDEYGKNDTLAFRYYGRDETDPPLRLLIRVRDKETTKSDRDIGYALVDLEPLCASNNAKTGFIVDLDDNAGKLHIQVSFESWPHACSRGNLIFHFNKGSNLKRISTIAKDDPYVLATLHPWKNTGRSVTSTKEGNADVLWPGMVIIPYPGIDNKSAVESNIPPIMSIAVYDQETIQRDRFIGRGWFNISKLFEGDHKLVTDVQLYDQTGVDKAGVVSLDVVFEPVYEILEEELASMDIVSDGNTKALLIGINYSGSDNELRGCHNDVLNIQKALRESYHVENFKLLMDSAKADKKDAPTANNIRAGLQWLLAGAKSGDKLFLHYSGHGTQVPDDNGDEEDGADESLCPLDFSDDPATWITDDELRSSFFEKIPTGVDVACIFDCCHSGTLSDLKLVNGRDSSKVHHLAPSNDANVREIKSRFWPPCESFVQRMTELAGQRKNNSTLQACNSIARRAMSISKAKNNSSIVVLSGCRDDQTSADACIEGKYTGAFTWAIVSTMNQYKKISIDQLMQEVKQKMNGKFSQLPQVSLGSSKKLRDLWLGGWAPPGANSNKKVVNANSEQAQTVEKRDISAISASEEKPKLVEDNSEAQTGEKPKPVNVIQPVEEKPKPVKEETVHADLGTRPLESGTIVFDNRCETPPPQQAQSPIKTSASQKPTKVASANQNNVTDMKPTGPYVVPSSSTKPKESNARSATVTAETTTAAVPIVPPAAWRKNNANQVNDAYARKEPTEKNSEQATASVLHTTTRSHAVGDNRKHTQKSKKKGFHMFRKKNEGSNNPKPVEEPKPQPKKKTSQGDDSRGNFFSRLHAQIDSMTNDQQVAQEREAYDAVQNKKVCPSCGTTQTFDEVKKRLKSCKQCGKRYTKPNVWSDVQDGFLKRNFKGKKTTNE